MCPRCAACRTSRSSSRGPRRKLHCVALAGQPADTGRGVEVLDEQARRAYRARLREIEAELAEAEAANDPGRAERLEEEKERLLDEMRKATGLGGRDRKMGDAARARALRGDLAHSQRDQEARGRASRARPASRQLRQDRRLLLLHAGERDALVRVSRRFGGLTM